MANASKEVLPIFIFDTNILQKLAKDDKRVSFIYQSVISLKKELQTLGLDLAIFYGNPTEVFHKLLLKEKFDEVVCSCDFDSYALKRDKEIESLVSMKRFYDSFLLHPNESLKSDGTPYKVFTPFYKNLSFLWESSSLNILHPSPKLRKIIFDYEKIPTLEEMGFKKEKLPEFLEKNPLEILEAFTKKIENYHHDRDFFSLDATSKLSVFLRFGTISVREIFNRVRPLPQSDFFIRELFWREFYNMILYYFPKSEFENFNQKKIVWDENQHHFQCWCEGNTGVAIIDASMRDFNHTGLMHNRLRMIVASYLTKNLFLPWQWGEEYFASKLLDFEKSSNVGSWQWSASTGADSVPYFRVFNPYSQSEKFDKEGVFIKSVIAELFCVDGKLFHKENGLQSLSSINYPKSLVDIKNSRKKAIEKFKKN